MKFLTLLAFLLPICVYSQIKIEDYSRKTEAEVSETRLIQSPGATSTCGNVQVTLKEQTMSGGCAGTLVLTYNYSDACGNKAQAERYVKLTDNTPPVFITAPSDVVAWDKIPGTPEVFATDNNGFKPKVELEETKTANQVIRKWTATDSCGNKSQHTQVVTVYIE